MKEKGKSTWLCVLREKAVRVCLVGSFTSASASTHHCPLQLTRLKCHSFENALVKRKQKPMIRD